MQDIIYIAVTVAFFAVCVAYVRGLDRIVRGAEQAERATDLVAETEADSASDPVAGNLASTAVPQ